MSSFFSSILNRVTGHRQSPSTWDDQTPLQPGQLSHKQSFKLAISPTTSFTKHATGAWAHGTISFRVQQADQPPSYDIAVNAMTAQDSKRSGNQLREGEEGHVHVDVEARYNDEEIWSASNVSLDKVGENDIRLVIETPSMTPSKIASQLSFFILVSFPPQLTSLSSLTTTASQWRHVGQPSLSSLPVHTVSLSTSNAPINFHKLISTTAFVKSANAPIEGNYEAIESLTIRTDNGPITGRYTCTNAASLRSSNGPINSDVTAKEVTVHTSNGPILGSYTSQGRLDVDSANGKIEGTFVCPLGGVMKNSNAPIKGIVKVGRGVLVLKGSNAEIDVDLVLERGAVASMEQDGEGTPPLLMSAEEEKKRLGAQLDPTNPGTSSSTPPSAPVFQRTRIEANTSNARIDLRLSSATGTGKGQTERIPFEANVGTSNAKVLIAYNGAFDGTFDLSTSNAHAKVFAPPSHTITYTNLSSLGKKSSGRIESEGGTGGGEVASEVKAKTANAEVEFRVV